MKVTRKFLSVLKPIKARAIQAWNFFREAPATQSFLPKQERSLPSAAPAPATTPKLKPLQESLVYAQIQQLDRARTSCA